MITYYSSTKFIIQSVVCFHFVSVMLQTYTHQKLDVTKQKPIVSVVQRWIDLLPRSPLSTIFLAKQDDKPPLPPLTTFLSQPDVQPKPIPLEKENIDPNVLVEHEPSLSTVRIKYTQNWKEFPAYYLSTSEQKSDMWLKERHCRITASIGASCVAKVSPSLKAYFSNASKSRDYTLDPLMLAHICCGLHEQRFNSFAQFHLNRGIRLEPLVRAMYSKFIGKTIQEEGLCVWKQDLRFACSLDGTIDEDTFIEIKCPASMPQWTFLARELERKGDPFNPIDIIPFSYYIQIQICGVITQRKQCHLIVCLEDALDPTKANDSNRFRMLIKIDYAFFKQRLLPALVLFYKRYITPLLKQYPDQCERIDPHSVAVESSSVADEE